LFAYLLRIHLNKGISQPDGCPLSVSSALRLVDVLSLCMCVYPENEEKYGFISLKAKGQRRLPPFCLPKNAQRFRIKSGTSIVKIL
jgi:hypothetical protein